MGHLLKNHITLNFNLNLYHRTLKLQFDEIQDSEVEDFKKLIAANIKKYRKEKKFSQLQLALSIGHISAALVAKDK